MANRFGSAAVEVLIVRLAKDPAIGIPDTDVGNRIHKAPVPDEYPYPFLTFFKRGARDIGPVGRGLPAAASLITYEVKGVDIGYSSERIDDPASRMDEALDGQSYQVDVDGTLYDISVTRTSEVQVEMPPEEDGSVFQHVGGIYDFYVARRN